MLRRIYDPSSPAAAMRYFVIEDQAADLIGMKKGNRSPRPWSPSGALPATPDLIASTGRLSMDRPLPAVAETQGTSTNPLLKLS